MITHALYHHPKPHLVPAITVLFSSPHFADPVVRIIPQPLVEAEAEMLGALGLTAAHPETAVGFTATTTTGFPAWAIHIDPRNAHHAVAVAHHLLWLRRQAPQLTARVKTRIGDVISYLDSSAPHFLPSFLEDVARFFVAGGNAKAAASFFTKARTIERTHSLDIHPERHEQVLREFAHYGVISHDILIDEIKNAAHRHPASIAYNYALALISTQAQAGTAIRQQSLRQLQLLAEAAGLPKAKANREIALSLAATDGLAHSPDPVTRQVARGLIEAPTIPHRVSDIFVQEIPHWLEFPDYVSVLRRSEIWQQLLSDDQACRDWLQMIFTTARHRPDILSTPIPDIFSLINTHGPALAGQRITTPVWGINPDYFDALLAVEVRWQPRPTKRQPKAISFALWLETGTRDLAALLSVSGHTELLSKSLSGLGYPIAPKTKKFTADDQSRISAWLQDRRAEHHGQPVKGNNSAQSAPSEASTGKDVTGGDFPAVSEKSRLALRFLFRAIDMDTPWDKACQHAAGLAKVLSNPQESGRLDRRMGREIIRFMFEEETAILGRLVSPHVDSKTRAELCDFFSWLARIGLLGCWVGEYYSKSTADGRPTSNVWDNHRAVLRYDFGYVRITPATQETDPVDGFIARDGFLAAIDRIRQLDSSGEPAWFEPTVHRLAAETAINPGLWRLALSGISPASVAGYHVKWDKADQDLLSVTATELSHLWDANRSLWNTFHKLLAAGWRDKYPDNGPDTTRMVQLWQQMWGLPWLHVTDDMFAIPIVRQVLQWTPEAAFRRDYVFERNGGIHQGELFQFYVHIAHLVPAGSECATVLADRIESFADYTTGSSTIALGAPYDQLIRRGIEAEMLSPRLVSEGYLRDLVVHLRTGTSVDGFAENPLVSAPSVVRDVEAELQLSPAAAQYYLQVLALSHPTDTEVKRWNGWTKKQLEAAEAELSRRQLVVTAKRATVGRRVFLPGGWLGKSPTGPAMEAWKASLYPLWKSDKTRPIVPGCPPLVPLHVLFQNAWDRCRQGDGPRYEDL
ncbi:hypothetical protein CMUST_10205 [Corynebacterium mustelae]|uniref:Uncharacterized protein n=1 Tax=Corynebacterium mustelae TaxID=571915 RepID=A0A0G3H5E9_9CORY|nr:hypothetical protein [Corynebacterium mustelae]AKK06357.1 hypothetical protein CMUST_10205 [Corynebacterium mustelae]